MAERQGAVTFHGDPLTLSGREPRLGRKAPDFHALNQDLEEVSLSDFAGRIVVISAVPSLDTPVCDRETVRFNQEAQKLGNGVAVLTVSMDLPFAQKRWCKAREVENLVALSDHRDADFARKYGVMIKELRLLARCVFVVSQDGKLMYQQLVPEISNEPDYDDVLDVVRAMEQHRLQPADVLR